MLVLKRKEGEWINVYQDGKQIGRIVVNVTRSCDVTLGFVGDFRILRDEIDRVPAVAGAAVGAAGGAACDRVGVVAVPAAEAVPVPAKAKRLYRRTA